MPELRPDFHFGPFMLHGKAYIEKGGAKPILPESIIIYNHLQNDYLMYHLVNPGAIRSGQVHTALTKRQLFFIR